MRQLTAGVSVVTSCHKGSLAGMTVTAVTSLSAEPPMLLACLNRSGQTYKIIEQSRVMCVNILSVTQTELAAHFAKPSDHKFQHCDWTEAVTGAPVINNAAVSFDCRVKDIVEAGTHGIVIGEILDITVSEKTDCLIYGNGQYGAFAAQELTSCP